MVLTKSSPYSADEIKKLQETFGVYIKTVIDLQKKVCCAGTAMHYEAEQQLLQQGSAQTNVWGGGIDTETKIIDFNSLINIRPSQNNTSNEIQDLALRKQFEELMKFFFKELYE